MKTMGQVGGRSIWQRSGILLGVAMLILALPDRESASRALATGNAVESGPGQPGERSGARINSLPEFSEYPLPHVGSEPVQIAVDSQGDIWITEQLGDRVARFHPPDASWQEYDMPSGSHPWGLALDAEGRVWVAAQGANQIACLDPGNGQWSFYWVPTQNSEPYDVAVGAGGLIWFTESAGKKIGALNPTGGLFTEFTVAELERPSSIAVWGSWVWFTDPPANHLVLFGVFSHKFSPLTPPTPGSSPQDLAMSATGDPWFTEAAGNQIAFFNYNTFTLFVEFPVQTPASEPFGLALDGSGAAWFTERQGNKVGRLAGPSPSEYTLPTANSRPTGIAPDSTDCAWYTAPGANRIGRVCLVPADYQVFLPLTARSYGP